MSLKNVDDRQKYSNYILVNIVAYSYVNQLHIQTQTRPFILAHSKMLIFYSKYFRTKYVNLDLKVLP